RAQRSRGDETSAQVGIPAGGWLRLGAAALAAAALLVGACSTSSSTSSGSTQLTNSNTAAALDSAYTSVVDAVGPSVVLIETDEGLGSGEVYDGNGDIITNAHVVGSATAFRVTTA